MFTNSERANAESPPYVEYLLLVLLVMLSLHVGISSRPEAIQPRRRLVPPWLRFLRTTLKISEKWNLSASDEMHLCRNSYLIVTASTRLKTRTNTKLTYFYEVVNFHSLLQASS